MLSYYTLLAVAVVLHRVNPRELTLLCAIGLSVLFPYNEVVKFVTENITTYFHPYYLWFLLVIVAEISVLYYIARARITSHHKKFLIVTNFVLLVNHFWMLNRGNLDVYSTVVVALEHSQLFSFIIVAWMFRLVERRE